MSEGRGSRRKYRVSEADSKGHQPSKMKFYLSVATVIVVVAVIAFGAATVALLQGMADKPEQIQIQVKRIIDGQRNRSAAEDKLSQDLLDLRREMNLIVLKEETRDCTDVAQHGHTSNGIYKIVVNEKVVEVFCEFVDGDNWMVFQRRDSGEENFYLSWRAYKYGFGNKSGEFWLGLESLHAITSSGSYSLRIDIEDWNNDTAYAEYSNFAIGNSTTNYALDVDGFSGTAGDSLGYHNNFPFTTKDRNNGPSPGNCATEYHGAWWYNACHLSNLNARYVDGRVVNTSTSGLNWPSWKNSWVSMKATKMKITRN